MIGNSARIHQQSSDTTIDAIRKEYEKQGADIEQIGNLIRKKFEVLLFELSKLLQIGTFEESRKIIELLSRNESVFINNSGGNANDLVKELDITLNSPNEVNLKQRLQTKINNYRKSDFANLKTIIKDLTLYQKVSMHPMSHGTTGLTSFTSKEIEESMILMEKLEKCISNFQHTNVTSI